MVTTVVLVWLNRVVVLDAAGVALEPKVEVGAEFDDIALMGLF